MRYVVRTAQRRVSNSNCYLINRRIFTTMVHVSAAFSWHVRDSKEAANLYPIDAKNNIAGNYIMFIIILS